MPKIRKLRTLYVYVGGDRNTSHILNCHLCGPSERRQVVMMATSSKYLLMVTIPPTRCDRYISHILNCYLCGASKLRQGVMVAPSS